MRSENSSSSSKLNSNNNNSSIIMNSTNSNSINNNNDETIFENVNFNSLNNNDHNNDNLRIGSYCTLRANRFRDDTTQNIILNRNDIASSSNSSSTASSTKRYNDPNNYCTMSKKLKRIIKSQLKNNDSNDDNNDNDLPYHKLNESQCDLSKYGLSNDLSTESIKNACDCYDEFSDDDQNNVNNLNKKQINLVSSQQEQQVLTNYKSRQQKSSESINKYLLEKLENRLADLNSNNIVSPLTISSSTVGTELASGYVTMDRKKHNLREQFHPYCTLRRELPINNSNHPLINNTIIDENLLSNNNNCENDDIFKSITNNESIAEAFNILNELDDILENTEFTSSFPSSSSSASSRSNTPTTASLNDNQDGRQSLLTICSESDKIEDYLLDLDNYLDEMDRQTPKLFLDENSINNLNDDNVNNEQNFKRSKTLPKKLKLMKSIINNDNDNHQIKQNNQLLDLEDNNNDLRYNENLRRGHILRNTIAGLRNKIDKAKKLRNCIKNENNVGNCSDDSSDNVDLIFNDRVKEKISTLPPRKTWRRNSMRKTALLPLPDQLRQHNNQLPSSADFISSTAIETLPSRNQNELINDCHEHAQEIETTVMDQYHHHHPESSQELINTNNNTSPNYNSLSLPLYNDVRRSLSQDNCTTVTHQLESLDQLDIINDILNNSTIPMNDDSATGDNNNRPRQIGRRAEGQPRLISIQTESIDSSGHRRLIINHDRPMSAPAGITLRRLANNNNNTIHHHPSTSLADPVIITAVPSSTVDCDAHRFIGSETSSVGSSRNPSPVSLLSSTASSSLASTQHDQDNDTTTTTATTTHQIPANRPSPLDPDLPPLRNRGINTYWPHEFSRILALLSCTLGLFNISRFSILTIHYGGNFLLQFLILSIIFGIPMLWLQMCLGSKIKSGPVSMWKISPICRGIGISLCLAQCIIALYSTISLSWVLVYLRDSFVRKNENYLWEESFHIYRRQTNITGNLTETVADYFNGIVLQRWQLGLGRRIDSGGVRFQLAFNLAIIWTAIFLILCKGLKSYGKIVLGLIAIPLVLFITITCKFLYIIDFTTVQNIFSGSDFEDFLINSKTWIAAAQENFLTWALLGPSIISICSRSTEKNPSKKVLRRDAILVVLLTLFGLSLAGIFGYACVQILHTYDYIYLPGSYENMDSYLFLFSYKTPIPPALISIPTKWVPHYSSVLGDMFRRPSTTPFRESGYQPLRLVTELFPAVVAVAQDQISSVWTVIGFLAFLFFGLAHLCAMWKPISNALGNSSSSVLLSCVTGLLLGISFATEMGLSMIHYLDIIIGGAWWILILWTAQILGLFLIRGRPYNGDVLVNDLRMTGSMSAFLALSWNVLLPIGLVSLAIIQYKISGSNQFFYWRGKSYFHFWARKLGGLIQVIFLLLVPFTSIIQIYRYLSSGPPDILDRIQLLYRPTASPLPHRRNRTNNNRSTTTTQQIITGDLSSMETQAVQDDAPPKYTPPPSYTTATGARLAKLLRQSIRRSVRRILGETSRSRPTLPNTITVASHNDNSSLPPEYSTVLSNPSGTVSQDDDQNIEIGPRALYNSYTQRTLSLERDRRPNGNSITISAQNHNRPASASNTTDRLTTTNTNNNNNNIAATNFTAIDVAQILRTSANHRHERSASALAARVDNVLRSSSLRGGKNSRSAENLVLNAAPLGQSSAVILNYENDTKNSENENTSVI